MIRLTEKHRTLREKILESIRDSIISGALKAGSKVSEPDLSQRYGISRTPIREALRQLESEGYLKVIPRRGAVVSSYTKKEIEEFYAIKSILEGYAARCACSKMTEKELAKLEAINSRLLELIATNDVKTFLKLDSDFHDLFIKAADNEKLRELITSLVSRFQRLRLMSLAQPERLKVSAQQHQKIIDAFRKKDAAKAEELVRNTAEYAGQVLIEDKFNGSSVAVL
ncbi:MAG: GntR family transcriptional regulator [Deltaproteobacteria bacterium]